MRRRVVIATLLALTFAGASHTALAASPSPAPTSTFTPAQMDAHLGQTISRVVGRIRISDSFRRTPFPGQPSLGTITAGAVRGPAVAGGCGLYYGLHEESMGVVWGTIGQRVYYLWNGCTGVFLHTHTQPKCNGFGFSCGGVYTSSDNADGTGHGQHWLTQYITYWTGLGTDSFDCYDSLWTGWSSYWHARYVAAQGWCW